MRISGFKITWLMLLYAMSAMFICAKDNDLKSEVIYKDDFSGDLSQWVVEQVKLFYM